MGACAWSCDLSDEDDVGGAAAAPTEGGGREVDVDGAVVGGRGVEGEREEVDVVVVGDDIFDDGERGGGRALYALPLTKGAGSVNGAHSVQTTGGMRGRSSKSQLDISDCRTPHTAGDWLGPGPAAAKSTCSEVCCEVAWRLPLVSSSPSDATPRRCGQGQPGDSVAAGDSSPAAGDRPDVPRKVLAVRVRPPQRVVSYCASRPDAILDACRCRSPQRKDAPRRRRCEPDITGAPFAWTACRRPNRCDQEPAEVCTTRP